MLHIELIYSFSKSFDLFGSERLRTGTSAKKHTDDKLEAGEYRKKRACKEEIQISAFLLLVFEAAEESLL